MAGYDGFASPVEDDDAEAASSVVSTVADSSLREPAMTSTVNEDDE
jgi:hypothetical protein